MKISNKYKNMLSGIEAVLFDLDGSLMDSMWLWSRIDVEFLADYGIDCPSTIQNDIEGMNVIETAKYFIERFELPDSEEKIIEIWNEMAKDKYANEVPLKDGAYEFLMYCVDNGIKLGICSCNTPELLDIVLKKHNIKELFGTIISGNDTQKGKPDPECYLKAAADLNVNPKKCLVFEDIVYGIMAGKNANMQVCAVEDDYSMYQKQAKMESADYYINTYKEIFDV